MVTLPRRLAAIVLTFVATLSLAATGLGSARDVINDFQDNQVIDVCHESSDYTAARNEPVDPSYGDLQGAIDVALANPALVGTSAKPCPSPRKTGGSNNGGVILAVVAIGLAGLAAGAVMAARRRRGGGSPPGTPGGGA